MFHNYNDILINSSAQIYVCMHCRYISCPVPLHAQSTLTYPVVVFN